MPSGLLEDAILHTIGLSAANRSRGLMDMQNITMTDNRNRKDTTREDMKDMNHHHLIALNHLYIRRDMSRSQEGSSPRPETGTPPNIIVPMHREVLCMN